MQFLTITHTPHTSPSIVCFTFFLLFFLSLNSIYPKIVFVFCPPCAQGPDGTPIPAQPPHHMNHMGIHHANVYGHPAIGMGMDGTGVPVMGGVASMGGWQPGMGPPPPGVILTPDAVSPYDHQDPLVSLRS